VFLISRSIIALIAPGLLFSRYSRAIREVSSIQKGVLVKVVRVVILVKSVLMFNRLLVGSVLAISAYEGWGLTCCS